MNDDKILIHIDSAEIADGILDRQVDNCPTCKSELHTSYGMASGGMGVYGYCEKCERVIWKCEDKSYDE